MVPIVAKDGQITIQETIEDCLVSADDMKIQAFTIGYEGKDIDVFIFKLKSRGIEQVIDVRSSAFSRKKGFSKNPLSERLKSEGIVYVHMSKLGSPKEIRDEYKAGGSSERFFEEYDDYVNTVPEEMALLLERVQNEKSVLMCFEVSYTECHRKILANRLNTKGISFIHI